jgi:hypothetical protein
MPINQCGFRGGTVSLAQCTVHLNECCRWLRNAKSALALWGYVPTTQAQGFGGPPRFGMAASLSRPVSSLGLITASRRHFALRRICHTGLWLLFEVGAKPPHDGMRRVGRYNLRDGLAANQRQDRQPLRTHPTRRPRGDIFLPEQNALFPPAISPSSVQAAAGTAVLFLLQRNSLPSTHIRCRTTARRLATATMARRIPRR